MIILQIAVLLVGLAAGAITLWLGAICLWQIVMLVVTVGGERQAPEWLENMWRDR